MSGLIYCTSSPIIGYYTRENTYKRWVDCESLPGGRLDRLWYFVYGNTLSTIIQSSMALHSWKETQFFKKYNRTLLCNVMQYITIPPNVMIPLEVLIIYGANNDDRFVSGFSDLVQHSNEKYYSSLRSKLEPKMDTKIKTRLSHVPVWSDDVISRLFTYVEYQVHCKM